MRDRVKFDRSPRYNRGIIIEQGPCEGKQPPTMAHRRTRLSKRLPGQRGFTLVELVVVIVILVLLVAIFIPPLRKSMRIARRVQCSFNLAHIGQAFAARQSDSTILRSLPFNVRGWAGILLPYLGGNAEELLCPEGGSALNAGWADAGLETFQVRFYGGGLDYFAEFAGPYVARMSDTQYQAIRAAGYLRHGANLLNYPGYSGYEPDGNPDVNWYCIEELQPASEHLQPGNPAHDYEDIRMRVTTHDDDDTVDLYFDLGSGGLDADILAQGRATPLITIPAGYPRAPTSAGPFEAGNIGLGRWTSYAMNSAVIKLARGERKILALDYQNKAIAESDEDFWDGPDWDPDGDGVPLLARHMGHVNVLFMDGSVESMRPQQINPATPSVARDYWEP